MFCIAPYCFSTSCCAPYLQPRDDMEAAALIIQLNLFISSMTQ